MTLLVLAFLIQVSGQAKSEAYFAYHGESVIQLELAVTRQEWARGMMNRKDLAANQGMFFVGEESRVQSFWMKNTLIPLDLIFLNGDGSVVHVHPNAVPHSEEIISSVDPAQHVLEIPGGQAKKIGIKKGDRIKLSFDYKEVLKQRKRSSE